MAMLEPPAPKRRPRKLYALAAIAAGAGVVAFELRKLPHLADEAYFWLIIAGLAILVGLVDLLAKPPDANPPS
jgi:hypothetical protein